jgi:hypothetical protein
MSRIKAMAGAAEAQISSTQATVPCGLLKACRCPRGAMNMDPGGGFLRLNIPGLPAGGRASYRSPHRMCRVRAGRPGEMSRDGDLHGREPRGPVLIASEDAHRLPRIR